MKTRFFCELCEQEYPTVEACQNHEVQCSSADNIYNALEALPGKVDIKNIGAVLCCFELIVARLRRMRSYLKKHDKPLAADSNETEHFFIGERQDG